MRRRQTQVPWENGLALRSAVHKNDGDVSVDTKARHLRLRLTTVLVCVNSSSNYHVLGGCKALIRCRRNTPSRGQITFPLRLIEGRPCLSWLGAKR